MNTIIIKYYEKIITHYYDVCSCSLWQHIATVRNKN